MAPAGSGLSQRVVDAVDRVAAMRERLALRLERAGVTDANARRVLASYDRATAHRMSVLRDDTHFETLHPGRTLLILLDDCDVRDADVLEAAASVESEHAALRVQPANALAAELPLPDGNDALIEALIGADDEVRLIALAERLDHARHLHLRERATWRPVHASIDGTYRPVAHRTHPRLARRYDWWCRMFARRFLAG